MIYISSYFSKESNISNQVKSLANSGFKNIFIESGILEALFELEYEINSETKRNIILKVFRNSAYINYGIDHQLSYKSKQINIYKPYQQILELSLQQAKNDIIENLPKKS